MKNKKEDTTLLMWWAEPESNRRHLDFQSSALPTELSALTIYYLRREGSICELLPTLQKPSQKTCS